MQKELKDSGVKFSVVCPGYVSKGMYADIVNKDPDSFNVPWITGEVTPKQVAEGVVRAISKGLPDVIVAPGPNRFSH